MHYLNELVAYVVWTIRYSVFFFFNFLLMDINQQKTAIIVHELIDEPKWFLKRFRERNIL